MGKKVVIIGHRQPDTDSVASVTGYAAFLNLAEPGKYIPARCGELNAETCFALETFGLKAPVLIDSIEPRVSDLAIHRISVTQDVPTVDVAALMDAHDIRNVPITDEVGRLVGIVGEHGLAQAYVKRQNIGELAIMPLPLDTLARILSARVVVKAADTLGGRVFIAINAPTVRSKNLTDKDIAIAGDNEPVQLSLIAAGIAALIIVDKAPVSEQVIREATQKGVSVLATYLDAFGVGTMINLSLPARMVMETDIPRLGLDDSLAHAKQVVYSSKFRSACVVEKDGMLRGIVTRTTLIDDVHRPVILLDHNEFAQAVEGIDTAEIIEIIDHHRLGAISTLKPVKFLNDPVGSTSTIITKKYAESGITPTPEIAGILLAGILSDTLILKMSTTTPEDHKMVAYLAAITGLDPVSFGTKLLERGMNIKGATMEDLLVRDTKRYELFGKKVIISQVMVPSFAYPQAHADEIQKELARLRVQQGTDIYLGLFTSVIENGSELFASAESGLLTKLGLKDQPIHLATMMSRKKDLIPWFGDKLRAI
ncbi:MAG: pyrophosphatase [Methanomicrobiales archaeon HGW-Methanomicrobiales-1]|jgi:manganese-dependent inorganic pyrophosphatase|nr:MAG: pyrophosphatase [Methanomicrobiales archaeon HGW-Methanomicrobiales-1]